MIKQIGLPLRNRPVLLITLMITDRIGVHSVLLPLQIILDEEDTIREFKIQRRDSNEKLRKGRLKSEFAFFQSL